MKNAATKPASKEPLEQYRQLVALLADRVRSVAEGFQTDAYVTGRSGVGKTYTVRQTLGQYKTQSTYLNGRITPAALYDTFEEHPEAIFIIDDVPLLFANLQASQILMAAAGGDPGNIRLITYLTKNQSRATKFRGGIIAISNIALAQDPAGQALASRFALHHFDPTDEMLDAFLTKTAARGCGGVAAHEALKILDYVRTLCRESSRSGS